MSRLGRLAVRRRKLILVVTGLLFVLSAGYGGGVAERLGSGGFGDPGAESAQSWRHLEETFRFTNPDVVLLVTAKRGSVDDAVVSRLGAEVTNRLGKERGVVQAVSYWTLGKASTLRSSDGDQALVLGYLTREREDRSDAVKALHARYSLDEPAATVRIGGTREVFRQINERIERDLAKSEALIFPITLVMLVFIFGGVIAAGLPLLVGGLAVVGTLAILQLLTTFTDVSVYSLNLTTAMGIGLGIDYSLFVVSRFREELRGGLEPHEAVIRTVETAGRTVVFSGATVAASLAALLVFPGYFLRSFAYAGIGVAVVAILGAVVSLPALLAVLGHRVDSIALRRRGEPIAVGVMIEQGFWHRVAMAVMRRPLPVAAVVMTVLIVLGLPFGGLTLGLSDDRVLPPGAAIRQTHEEIARGFGADQAETISIVIPNLGPLEAHREELTAYAKRLSRLEHVARVEGIPGTYEDGVQVSGPDAISSRFIAEDNAWLAVLPNVKGLSAAGEALVREIRAIPTPFERLVSGQAADLVDVKATLADRLPIAGGLIAITTVVLLFMMFGSLLVPAKALVLNMLSLTATFGAMVWVFQDGHLAGLLDFTPTGMLDADMPVLMFCIAFGLSMDYEVFLLSRIKEEHDRGAGNTEAVALGLERTGRIVTASAALMAVVFLAISTSSISFLKLFGLGLALAVVVDATLIRAALVPAFMRLAGRANWWAPPPLRRFHDRFGFKGH